MCRWACARAYVPVLHVCACILCVSAEEMKASLGVITHYGLVLIWLLSLPVSQLNSLGPPNATPML